MKYIIRAKEQLWFHKLLFNVFRSVAGLGFLFLLLLLLLPVELRVGSNMILFLYILLLLIWHMYFFGVCISYIVSCHNYTCYVCET